VPPRQFHWCVNGSLAFLRSCINILYDDGRLCTALAAVSVNGNCEVVSSIRQRCIIYEKSRVMCHGNLRGVGHWEFKSILSIRSSVAFHRCNHSLVASLAKACAQWGFWHGNSFDVNAPS
jgi:hypothetical protein